MSGSLLADLLAAGALDGTELVYVVQGGADRRATTGALADLALVRAGFAEAVEDVVGAMVADSADIDVTYNDGTDSLSAVLTTTGVTAGSYGSGTVVATFTVDSKGRITAAGTASITPAGIGAAATSHGHAISNVTGLQTALDGKHVNITFQDEGTGLGAAGTASVVNFTGAGVTASRSGNTVTVNIPGGGGGGLSDGDYGDITVGGGGTTLTIDNGVVTLAKMADLANARFIGRTTAGTGVPEALTAAQATALLDVATSSAKGLAPASGGGTTNFLRADLTWAAPPSGGGGALDGYVAGWWLAPYSAVPGASAALAANTIRFIPFRLARTVTVTGLGARATNSTAGANAQLAIYASDDAEGRPTGSALISTGNLSIATAGVVSETSLGPVTLTAGEIYWAAVNVSSSSATMQAIATGNVSPIAQMIGVSDLASLSSGVATMAVPITLAQTFGSWPDVTSSSFTEGTSNTQVMVYLQIGTLP